jgi:hypothetical protein
MSIAAKIVAHMTGEDQYSDSDDEYIDDELQRYMYNPDRAGEEDDFEEFEDEGEEYQPKSQTKKPLSKKTHNFKKDKIYVYVPDDEAPVHQTMSKAINGVVFNSDAVECFKMNWAISTPKEMTYNGMRQLDLRRMGMASHTTQGKIYVSGGRDSKYTYGELYSYDWDKNEWRTEVTGGPKLSDHFMYSPPGHNHLLFYSGGRQYYVLQNGTDPDTSKTRSWKEGNSHADQGTIEPVHHSSFCLVGNRIYVFGGKLPNSGKPVNQLYYLSVTLTRDHYSGNDMNVIYKTQRVLVKSKQKFAVAPPPRYDHAVASVGDQMYVFGGIGNDNKVLNDLWVCKGEAWSQIDCAIPPPPLYGHSMLFDNTNHHMFLYGGITAEKTVSNAIYRYDTESKQWSLNVVRGPEPSGASDNPTQHQIPLAFHSMSMFGNSMVMFGGMTNYETRELNTNALLLHNTIDNGAEISQWQYMRDGFRQEKLCDIALRVVTDDEQGHEYIKTHKCILTGRCPEYFNEELLASAEPSPCDLPALECFNTYHASVVRALIEYLYTGNLELRGGNKLMEELIEVSQRMLDKTNSALVHRIVVEGHKATLDITRLVLESLEQDMNKLYTSCIDSIRYDVELENTNPTFADVRIELVDPADDSVFLVMEAHKFILCRSGYIDKVFKSGMEETLTNVIKFQELSEQGLVAVLKFIYSNQISVRPENCIEVLIASLLFRFNDLAAYCRSMVTSHLSLENVISVLQIADHYQDTVLKRTGITFASKNYEEISKKEEWTGVSEEIRNATQEKFVQQAKKLEKKALRQITKATGKQKKKH